MALATSGRRQRLHWLLILATGLAIARLQSTLASEVYQAECRGALGMHSGQIKDEQVTASSSYDGASVGPHNARIRRERNGGAWCPKQQVSRKVREWLEIDLRTLQVVSLVETQGRFGNGQGQEFAENYFLEYKREANGRWISFTNRRNQQLFDGNINTYIAELREINPTIVARFVRIIPYSIHPRTVCMRVELYGCSWKSGLLSYSMRQGNSRGTGLVLYDLTYDGKLENSILTEGLGQLVDGEEGESNFRLDPKNNGKKGYEWVGWKNESSPPVEIIFQFDMIRNFSGIYTHSNNMFSKDVRVFRRAELYFSLDGKTWSTKLDFEYRRDELMEFARTVVIPINHILGNFVKLLMFFDGKWIMISEITFISDAAATNYTLQGYAFNDAELSNSPEMPIQDEFISVIIGVLAALILLLFIIVGVIIIRRHRKKQNGQTLKNFQSRPISLNMSDLHSAKIIYNSVSQYDYNSTLHCRRNLSSSHSRKLPELPKVAEIENDTYSIPDGGNTSFLGPTIPNSIPPPSCTMSSLPAQVSLIQGASGSATYCLPNSDLFWEQELPLTEFPRENLIFREKLGSGQFGEINLCEIVNSTLSHTCTDLNEILASVSCVIVAVKTLYSQVSQQARDDFEREVKILSHLKDVNIVQLLGVCSNEPLMIVTEYTKYGDLHAYLNKHNQEDPMSHSPSDLPSLNEGASLSYGCLIYMSTQIASGMKYLETLNLVHRDLAARNCLVGEYFNIKICDLGMSRALYAPDYYQLDSQVGLPLRWMAWESILLGKFSTKSDVWSFAVTLWEILTMARCKPLSQLHHSQVIENANKFYLQDEGKVIPEEPKNCPKEIFDLICECWNRNELSRPSFKEIHMFLSRKNMGYEPKYECI